MNCARSWRTRGRRSCGRESHIRAALAAPLALLLSGCAGLFQQSLPDRPAEYQRVLRGAIAAGFAEADITPPDSQYLAGFTLAKPSTGVQSRLKARAAVFVVGGRRLAVVGIDSLGLQREDVDWIKSSLTGFANGDVFLCASHTHAAPDLVGLWGYYFLTSGRDVRYLELVRRGVVSAVQQALSQAQPATLWHGEARLPRRGVVGNSNRREVFNPRVTVLAARAQTDAAPLGAVLHLACHPEMMRRDNTELSADLSGALCDQWRSAGLGQGVFVNGELGAMVTPAFRPRGAEGLPLIGARLLAACRQALAAAQALDADEVVVRRQDVYVPLQAPGLVLGRLTGTIHRELYGGHLRTSVGYLRIGDFEAVSVPGELEPVLAMEIRRVLHRPNLVFFGLVDDEIGYILRHQDAVDPEFAYERTMSPGRVAGERIRAALVGR